LKDYNSAIDDLNIVITNYPKEAESLYRRGDCKFMSGDSKGAISDFNAAIRVNDQYAPAYYGRAMVNISLGSLNDVCPDITKAKDLGFDVDNDMLKKYCK